MVSGKKEMSTQAQIQKWIACAGAMLALAGVPLLAQNHRNDAPRPNRQEQMQRQGRTESRPQPRAEAPRPNNRQQRMEPRPRPRNEAPRPYQPPAEGHHSGQWLNQHRNQPLEQQRQALQNDRDFRRLPPDRQQKFEQRLQRFDNMPPEHQERVLRRMETWEHLTPQQKQTFRATDSQFRSLPPDRRQAVRNAIETLRAMPPQVRQREIESGRFSRFSTQERQVLNDAAQLPLAPAEGAPQSEPPRTGPQRYIPRPPH
jgi:phage-related protein